MNYEFATSLLSNGIAYTGDPLGQEMLAESARGEALQAQLHNLSQDPKLLPSYSLISNLQGRLIYCSNYYNAIGPDQQTMEKAREYTYNTRKDKPGQQSLWELLTGVDPEVPDSEPDGYIQNPAGSILIPNSMVENNDPTHLFEKSITKFFRDQGIDADQSQVVSRTKSSQFTAIWAIFAATEMHQKKCGSEDPDKNVFLMVEPYWDALAISVVGSGSSLRAINTTETGFKLTAGKLREVIGEVGAENIAGMFLTIPNNSTMSVYSKDELQELADVIAEYNINTISDELYSGMERPGTEHTPLASLTASDGRSMHDLVFTNNGGSKTLNLNKQKFGFGTTGNRQWIDAVLRFSGVAKVDSPDNPDTQLMATYFYNNMPTEYLDDNRQAFAKSAEVAAELINCDDMKINEHDGGYMNALKFSRELLEEYGITSSRELQEYLVVTTRVVTNSVMFEGEDFISVRVNFFDEPEDFKEAMGRIRELVERMRGHDEDRQPPSYGSVKDAMNRCFERSEHVDIEVKQELGLA